MEIDYLGQFSLRLVLVPQGLDKNVYLINSPGYNSNMTHRRDRQLCLFLTCDLVNAIQLDSPYAIKDKSEKTYVDYN